MFVKVTGSVKNAFGRIIPEGMIIEVQEQRGRELIRMDLAELVSRDIRNEYQNQVQAIKNNEKVNQQPGERKRSWFGRLIGL